MFQSSFQQRISDAPALLSGIDEQLGEKPEIPASPTPGASDDAPALFGHPEAVRIVPKAKKLKIGRACRRHRAEAVPNGKIVDA
ncbi:hypothetical protein N182_12405 [Sinorhizobium sp. GL2]|nr:hypothetical protein N182_12405 [Sinorhizobium sp. GL2]